MYIDNISKNCYNYSAKITEILNFQNCGTQFAASRQAGCATVQNRYKINVSRTCYKSELSCCSLAI